MSRRNRILRSFLGASVLLFFYQIVLLWKLHEKKSAQITDEHFDSIFPSLGGRPQEDRQKGDKEPAPASVPSDAGVKTSPVRKWAYVFLAGGCSSKKPEHIGFVASIAVAAHQLQKYNSTADVVVFIQMSHDSMEETLPEAEVKLLEAVPSVRVKYIPRYSNEIHENFYTLMMEKFRVLNLTEYSRVLFMDSDIMPLRSLDYFFDKSEPDPKSGKPALLQENVILTGNTDPATGGFFMLKPNHTDYSRGQEIINKVEQAALNQPWPHWDPIEGWGHKIHPSDKWLSSINVEAKGVFLPRTNWTWHGSFADQGFLYHWVKYEKNTVSIITAGRIDNYTSIDGKPHLLGTFYNRGDSGLLNILTKGPNITLSIRKNAPFYDFHHFTGKKKPWKYHDRSIKLKQSTTKYEAGNLVEVWLSALEAVEKIANVTLEFPAEYKAPPLGRYPVLYQRINHIKMKAKNNFTMYEHQHPGDL